MKKKITNNQKSFFFEDYTEVRQSEIDMVKNTKIIDKVIPNPQDMYGKINI